MSVGCTTLPLQVGEIDGVVIDDTQRADAGSGEIQQERRAENRPPPTTSNPRRHQLRLPVLADPRRGLRWRGRSAGNCGLGEIHGRRGRRRAAQSPSKSAVDR